MRIAIRADASTWIGTGHVMRCATLAAVLRASGAEVCFISRSMPGDRCDWLVEQGYTVHPLEAVVQPLAGIGANAYSDWLGVSLEEEIQDSISVLSSQKLFDWLIVDHYALGADWERAMRQYCRSILAIDDLANRDHDCDLLLDQNLVENLDTRYEGRLPPACRTMLGPQFALLQPAYASWHVHTPVRVGPVRRLVVFFGGVDADNLTGRALKALAQTGRTDIAADVVVGAGNPHREEISRMAADMSNVQLHGDLPSLASLMAAADLALGASGSTSWERCCLGLPSLVVTLAENQVPIARELDKQGIVRWLGNASDVDERDVACALEEVFDEGIDADWSRRSSTLVDGAGAARVAAVLAVTSEIELTLRDAEMQDEARLLEWANDPVVRQHAFSTVRIKPEEHRHWFQARLADRNGCRIYIALTTLVGMPVGQVRLELRDGSWIIGYSIDRLFRGLGMGRPLLGAVLLRHASEVGACRVIGRVKNDNPASFRIFERLGFSAVAISDSVTEFRLAIEAQS